MRRLVESLADIVAERCSVDDAVLDRIKLLVAGELPRLKNLLQVKASELGAGRYLAYKHPSCGFVVMILVWGPRDATPIHDHGVWGVEAVLQGCLTVTEYDDDLESPRPLLQHVFGPGAVMHNLPPDRDVHKVENSGSGLAMSVHIYGREITGNRQYVAGQGFQPAQLKQRLVPLALDQDLALDSQAGVWVDSSML